MANTSMLHVRLEDDLKARGNAVLESIGFSASEAIRLFYKRIVAEQALPLELKVPNVETQAAMKEARELMKARSLRFKDGEALISSLDG